MRSDNLTGIYYGAFMGCRSLKSVTIPNTVISIGSNAFCGCSSLTTIVIPNSVMDIGSNAFEGCTGLTSVTIPNSVTSIKSGCFSGCSSLTSVTIPNNVTRIENGYVSAGVYVGAFSRCSSLTSITIPNSVTYIGSYAFSGCSSLTSLTIPKSVTSIGRQAFDGCNNLAEVVSLIENPFYIAGKESGGRTFTLDVFNNATLYVPVGTKEKYKATEGWKDFLLIEEGTGGGETPNPRKCATPTIGYMNGELKFSSDTEGAICQSTITDTDITSYSSNNVKLSVTYHICV